MKHYSLPGFIYKALCKKIFLSFFILLIGTKQSFGATKTWTGLANDGLWSSATNWSGNSLPLNTDDILLDNSTISGNYIVTLPNTAVTIKTVTINPSGINAIQLILPSSNTVAPAFTATGPRYGLVINNGGIFKNSSGAANMLPVAISDSIKINNGGRFIQNTQRSHAANVTVLSKAPGTEKGIFEFDVPGTQSYSISFSGRTYGTVVFSSAAAGGSRNYFCTGTNTVTINGDLQINAGVNFNMQIGGANGNIIVNGDYIQNGGIFNLASAAGNSTIVSIKGNLSQSASAQITETNSGTRVIELNGSVSQNISLAGTISDNTIFRINNTAGTILSAPLKLPYNLNLLQGKITTTSANLLTMLAGSTISVDSTIVNTSYVDGPLRKEGLSSSSYSLFPVGKNGSMHWLELKNATGNFTVEFINSNPRDLSTTYASGIDHVGTNYYWNIDADVSPVASANVELSFSDATNIGVTDMATLRVAQLTGSTWTNRNNTITTGSAGAAGSVVSENINAFNSAAKNFALASSVSNENPLPVTFVSFYGKKLNDNSAQLNWQIDSPNDVAYFEIQSSVDDVNFNLIGKVNGINNQNDYQFADDHLQTGIIYYRIKLVEKTGIEHLSKIVAVNNNQLNFYIVSATPLIANNTLLLRFNTSTKTSLQFILIGMDGRMMKKIFVQAEAGDNNISLDISGVASGVYIISAFDSKGNLRTTKFIKQ
jgi:hypothetical protein